MDEEDVYDAIVVGAGCAGSIAAYKLASAGKSVLLVDRGSYPGAKNMTGGRLYTHSLKRVFPDFEKEAPLERKITNERISLVSEDSMFTMGLSADALREDGKDSYSVLRGAFDPWLAGKAEEAGADVIPGVVVDDVIVRDGKVCGIIAAGEEMEAKVTILCDGANSLLGMRAGLTDRVPTPAETAVGAKELIQLSEKQVEDRFNLLPGEGVAWMFAGDCTDGQFGGMFLYANKDTISLGVVAALEDLSRGKLSVAQMLEDFKHRDEIAPLIDGGTLIEYSGHLVPEGGYNSIGRLYGDGVLITGDSAGLCMNLGYCVRGMDLAITSGEFAAEAVIEALDAGDTSSARLKAYEDKLRNSYLLKDMRKFRNTPEFLASTARIFDGYPQMIRDIMLGLFKVDGTPTRGVKKAVMGPVKKMGMMQIVKDVMKGAKSL